MVLSLHQAERIVEKELRRLEQDFQPRDLVINREGIREYVWGWLIPYGTRLWVEGRDPSGVIFGGGPFCVARDSGAVEELVDGSSYGAVMSQVRRFERRIGFRPWWKFW